MSSLWKVVQGGVMKICPECKRKGTVPCPVCKGSGKDPRNSNASCGYCNGKGVETCSYCNGKGEVPDDMFHDRPR